MVEKENNHVRTSASRNKTLGIAHRTTPLACSWTGDMRVRFSDFQVNEISKDGSVIHLKTVGLGQHTKPPPQAPEKAGVVRTDDSGVGGPKVEEPLADGGQGDVRKAQAEPSTIDIAAEDVKVLEDVAGAKLAQELLQLFNGGNGPEPKDDQKGPQTVTSDILDDKATRARIHGEVRRIFKSRLDTSTNAEGAIVASYLTPRKNNRNGRKSRGGQRQRRDGGDGGGGALANDEPVRQYLHFTLYKDNRDTMDAVNQIARLLRMKPQTIGYAGTKDRRASTTQRCSVRHQRKTALAGLNGRLWGISTGDYEYRDEPVHLGQLLGNEFVITLKNCRMADEAPSTATPVPAAERRARLEDNVQSALGHMATHGWLNYFGHQRFGTHAVGTHQIGQLILSDDFEGAVKALLHYDPVIAAAAEEEEEEAASVPDEPSKRDEYLRHQACMLFLTGKDATRAASIIPRRYAGEACVLRHLTRLGQNTARDFPGAMTHITRGLRSMYLHAYQSHVWNHVASHRFSLHGTTVVKGDLVLCDASSFSAAPGQQEPASNGTSGGCADDGDDDEIINPAETTLGDDADGEDAPLRARPLSHEEALSGKYTIHDVVLPSPGYDVIYPDNEVGLFYAEFMGRAENGGLDPHKMRRLRREFSLPGRYRKLMQRFLGQPSVQVRLYADDMEQMHPTDMDLINGKEPHDTRKRPHQDDEQADGIISKKARTGQEATPDTSEQPANGAEPDVADSNGDQAEAEPRLTKLAVIAKFQLASSAYATVALRELMGDGPEAQEDHADS
ncbi:pseudouridine synthase TruD/Pus7 [Moelleriella libera RCEF 2490]|uniref:Pseudouridine synthase TruD/Pus7 n=1 Tax=Moelleriella libera RCEF 2490 TaxID=1081109 RepID=A0A166PLV4_9HYPO|nr:pseudouridine synthase TruD/Pus7 [Moelleriella libera RCEF 2490]